jgi:hypothetical protein
MYDESMDLIRESYDHREGSYELFHLLAKTRGDSGKSMLSITNLDKKIKLNQMTRTWEFTRPGSMALKLVETFFYMIISNT